MNRGPTSFISSRLAVSLLASLLILTAASCSTPRMEGPNIADPPEGFVYDANGSQSRNIFANEDIIRQSSWTRPNEDNYCSITMTEYRGPATRQDTQEALDYFIKRYGYQEYGPLENLTIDGRPAWGWTETQFHKGEQASLAYKAVVSYEGNCWAVEFFARDPAWQNKERLKATISSFRRG